MSTSRNCGICDAADSKYKCPTCSMRYCSVACYKPHKASHVAEQPPDPQPPASAPTNTPTTTPQPTLTPHPTRNPPKPDYTSLASDPALAHLLLRYPLLRAQLQLVYGLTLDPGPDHARGWNRAHLLPSSPHHRGRGGHNRGSARSGRGDENPHHGMWTYAKGEAQALDAMNRMRMEDREGGVRRGKEMEEGLREFAELCRGRFPEAFGQEG